MLVENATNIIEKLVKISRTIDAVIKDLHDIEDELIAMDIELTKQHNNFIAPLGQVRVFVKDRIDFIGKNLKDLDI